jgi:hypothetical protein
LALSGVTCMGVTPVSSIAGRNKASAAAPLREVCSDHLPVLVDCTSDRGPLPPRRVSGSSTRHCAPTA